MERKEMGDFDWFIFLCIMRYARLRSIENLGVADTLIILSR